MTPAGGGPPGSGEWRPSVNPWIVTTAVMLPTFMEVLDTSIATVALPHIAGSLAATPEEATWVLTSYLVSNAIVLPASAWFARYFGRARFLIACIILFTAASLASGLATSLSMLVISRAVQGAGGGALQPISQAILLESFPPEKRGMAMAAFGVGVVVAPIIGPTLGGWLTDNYSWRWVFYINLPIGILAVIMTRAFVEDPPYIKAAKPGRIDTVGFGLMAVSLAALQIILDKGQQDDWFAATWIRWFAIISATAMIAFIVRELVTREPIVNLRAFRNRSFAVGTGLIGLVGVVLYAAITLLPLYLQTLMGYTAFLSGLAVSPRGLGALAVMPVMGILTTRLDPRKLVFAGFLVVAASIWMLGRINLEISIWFVVWPSVLTGVGLGMVFVPLTTATMATLPQAQIGNATGIFNLLRNIGGAAGISVMTTLLQRQAQTHQAVMVSHLSPGDLAFAIRTQGLQGYLEGHFSPADAAHRAQAVLYQQLQQQSQLWAFVDDFRLLAILSVLCAAAVFLLRRVPTGRPAPVA